MLSKSYRENSSLYFKKEFDIELKKENKYQIKILAFDENQRPKMQSYSMSIK